MSITVYKIQEYNKDTGSVKYVSLEDYQKIQEEYLRVIKILNQIELDAGTGMKKAAEFLLGE